MFHLPALIYFTCKSMDKGEQSSAHQRCDTTIKPNVPATLHTRTRVRPRFGRDVILRPILDNAILGIAPDCGELD